MVSTHSRPKAAAIFWLVILATSLVSTHSRPKAAALFGVILLICAQVSTHSRPKAAAALGAHTSKRDRCFNTQPPEGGCNESCIPFCFMPAFQHTAARRRLQFKAGGYMVELMFQHTAARRRLQIQNDLDFSFLQVSTHSRPKAAAQHLFCCVLPSAGFNTQPPEGGCSLYKKMIKISRLFTVFRYSLKHKEWEGV